jgi:dihydroflavonol-4-reductase
MKILVTGGTGFLGAHLVPMLRESGHAVRVIGRTAPPAAWCTGTNPVEFVRADLKDRESVRAAVADVDAVYHLAGLVSFHERDGRAMYELHVDRTRELLRDIHSAGHRPRFILASTSGTIAVSKEERIGRECDRAPIEVVGRWPYYLSKIYQEQLAIDFCSKNEIPLIVLNPSLLMGPGDDRLSSTWTVVKFIQRDIPAIPGGAISLVDVRDVARAAVNALTRGDLHGRHLMGLNLTMADFFGRLERLTGVPSPKLRLPRTGNILGARLLARLARWRGLEPTLDPQEVDIGEHCFWLDSSKAQDKLDFRARDVYETLYDTVKYLREHRAN